ncbi:MAG: polysaccharide deacetylase family protein [Draconibacterium sp.]
MKILSVFLFISVFMVSTVNAQFKWPDGKKAAVIFTYDDGLDCHLDIAVPQLEEFGFKGTFFCTGNSESLSKRMEEWREIAENGHEIGNHTLFHPCDGSRGDWVKPEYDLKNYSPEQIVNELRTANTLLKAVDGKAKRTYAFTCSDFEAGDFDFSGEVEKLFVAARLDGPVPESMKGYNIYKAPSWGVNNPSADELISYINEARENGTIAVFMFHSVGGGYLNVGAEEHRKLLEYLKENEVDFYNSTFMEVMEYIKANQ